MPQQTNPQGSAELHFDFAEGVPRLAEGPDYLAGLIGRSMRPIVWWQLYSRAPDPKLSKGYVVDPDRLLGHRLGFDVRSEAMELSVDEIGSDENLHLKTKKGVQIWYVDGGTWRLICIVKDGVVLDSWETDYNEPEAAADAVAWEANVVANLHKEATAAAREVYK